MEKEKVECTGKGVFSLVMGIIYLIIDIYLFILTIKMEQVVIPIYLIVSAFTPSISSSYTTQSSFSLL